LNQPVPGDEEVAVVEVLEALRLTEERQKRPDLSALLAHLATLTKIRPGIADLTGLGRYAHFGIPHSIRSLAHGFPLSVRPPTERIGAICRTAHEPSRCSHDLSPGSQTQAEIVAGLTLVSAVPADGRFQRGQSQNHFHGPKIVQPLLHGILTTGRARAPGHPDSDGAHFPSSKISKSYFISIH
jgi:hypothetical protein